MSKREYGEQVWPYDVPDQWSNSPQPDNATERKRKRKSRWTSDPVDKAFIPGMPTVIPAGLNKDQEEMYLLQLQIEEISRRLRTGDLGIPLNPEERSPSPEPIYNSEGKRLNTREYRTRKRLEEERHQLVQKALSNNPEFKPPPDYKPPIVRVSDKVMIPQEEHPDINFVGLLIGPRGNTLKNLEKDTGAKIIIRGKGSVKEGKIGRKDGQPLPGEDEPLHAYVTANNPENVKKAVEKIKEIIRQGIEVPEGQNDLRRQQLRELALLNGTLRENDGLSKLKQIQQAQTIITNTILCTICGGTGHIAQDCKQKRPGESFRNMTQVGIQQSQVDKAKMDSEYMSLMAELGEGPPPPANSHGHHSSMPNVNRQYTSQPLALPAPPWSAPAPPAPVRPPMNNPSQSQPPPNIPPAPPMYSSAGPVPPPWQAPNSGPPSNMSRGPPPPPLIAAPPPPPPTSQPPQSTGYPWQQPPGMMPPPPPPGSMAPPPWATQSPPVGPVPPPPPSGVPPWQQGNPPPVPPVGAPPPPPPGSQFNPVPPPPPPHSSDNGMPTIPLGVPPPPPPN